MPYTIHIFSGFTLGLHSPSLVIKWLGWVKYKAPKPLSSVAKNAPNAQDNFGKMHIQDN